jgi:preprotein translocase subunit SecA
MFKAFSSLFDSNERILKDYQKTVDKINALEKDTAKLSDEAMASKSQEFKDRLEKGESLDDLLPEAFALVREASKRTLGLRHFDVQLMAGIGFHQGKVSEQKTGEGKTLSATTAVYLNALTGRGVHVVTVNDYLARRDAGWMAKVYHFLGLSTGVIFSGKGDQPAAVYDTTYKGERVGDERLEHLRPTSRKDAYAADITYGTNNEFGFDYLRDNMVGSLDRKNQRDHYFAIIDEVDSILIDEARTPLIISAPDTDPTDKYYDFARLVDSLQRGTDYDLDEKTRNVSLTDYGLRRLEKRLNVANLYEDDYNTIHHVEQALKAKTLFQRDTHYVVKDNQVIIVDENTGRLMFGRRYSDGLHQAIEAKENVTIQQESRTLATISLQNYFRMYDKLAGMTGTAATEAEEFSHIYKMDVIVVPTHQDIKRIDHPDVVYKTMRAKYGALVKEIGDRHEKGQPVLVGTRSIEQNQIISRYLKRLKITHNVLNAKNHEQEAQIIANAGLPGGVTVATNIAGRGVDIVLGGSAPEKPNLDETNKADHVKLQKAYEKELADWQERHDQVVHAGGLHVVGAERHDSRRIDNQLRGRSGRQGDPGSSRFYVSLEDDLMRIFGGEQVSKIMTMLRIPEDQPIESGMVSKSIQQAQSKVEGFHFDQRKRVVEYDDVMNKQREIIYKRREKILSEVSKEDSEDRYSRERLTTMLEESIETMGIARIQDDIDAENAAALVKDVMTLVPFDKNSQDALVQQVVQAGSREAAVTLLQDVVAKTYEQREAQLGNETMHKLEQYVLLSSLDEGWMDHLDAIDDLREGIWLRGGKEQVLAEYKKEAFQMFERLLGKIEVDAAHRIFRVQLNESPKPSILQQAQAHKQELADPLAAGSEGEPVAPISPQNKASVSALAAAMAKTAGKSGSSDGRTMRLVDASKPVVKVGRNDPCPCGSGLKYKKCGLINSPSHKA